MALLFQDLFTDPDGTLLTAHVPNVPGSGTYDSVFGSSIIQGNRLKIGAAVNGSTRTRFTQDIVGLEGDGDWFFDMERNNSIGLSSSVSLRARSRATNDEGVQLVVQFNTGTTVNLFIQRTDASGVGIDSFQVFSGLAFVNLAQFRFGLTLTGTTAQAWTEPYGGGTRTNRGAAVTLTGTYSDANHRRIAIAMFNASGIAQSMAFVDVLTGPGVLAQTIIPTGVASAEAFGAPTVDETAFGTECHAVTKAGVPVFAEIECTPPA